MRCWMNKKLDSYTLHFVLYIFVHNILIRKFTLFITWMLVLIKARVTHIGEALVVPRHERTTTVRMRGNKTFRRVQIVRTFVGDVLTFRAYVIVACGEHFDKISVRALFITREH